MKVSLGGARIPRRACASNDVGTQYSPGIYAGTSAQKQAALATRDAYEQALHAVGHGPVTTETLDAPTFYYAEDHHQQYARQEPEWLLRSWRYRRDL